MGRENMTDDEAIDAIRKFQEDPVFEKLESSIDIAIKGLYDLLEEEDRKHRRRVKWSLIAFVGSILVLIWLLW